MSVLRTYGEKNGYGEGQRRAKQHGINVCIISKTYHGDAAENASDGKPHRRHLRAVICDISIYIGGER